VVVATNAVRNARFVASPSSMRRRATVRAAVFVPL